MKHPVQPVYLDENLVARFKPNKIVQHLFDTGALDLNQLATISFPDDDRQQLAQLLGYSVDGYADLSYASGKVVHTALAYSGAPTTCSPQIAGGFSISIRANCTLF